MKSTLKPDITPESHPDHHVVGQDVMGWSHKRNEAARFHCYSHDASGYNLVDRADDTDHRNVSERAIGRTFHIISDYGNGVEMSQWGRVTIDKDGRAIPPRASTVQSDDTVDVAHGWDGEEGFEIEAHPMKASDAPSPFFQPKPTIN